MKVEKWIAYEDVPESEEMCFGWLGGWFNSKEGGKRWKDYIDVFQPVVLPYLEAVRADVVHRNRRLTGEDHQYSSEGVPLFTDGKCLCLTYRAWGDLMAAIWSEKENKDYNYMDFYM